MFLWIILAVLTAAVAAVLLVTLARGAKSEIPDRAGEIAVYRDQMAELERDREQGLISAEEAEYAKAEIGRRLLSAAGEANSQSQAQTGRTGMTATGAAVTLLVPAVGLSLYLLLGSPQLPDQPLAARLENPGQNMALLVAKAERHLAELAPPGIDRHAHRIHLQLLLRALATGIAPAGFALASRCHVQRPSVLEVPVSSRSSVA